MTNVEWLKRRWYDFRNGHNVYLIFAMAFFQFVVITYALAIDGLPALKAVFPSMSIWGGFFISVYVPAAVIVGHFHRKHQMPTETRQTVDVNPFTYQAQPGKERLYGMRLNRIAYGLQLKSMEMHNSIADAITQLTGKPIPKWSKDDFQIVEENRYITERLEKGDNIIDIYNDLKHQNKIVNDKDSRKDIPLEG